jgi:two-component system phosphate regulon sensor histidine kinase PhoR
MRSFLKVFIIIYVPIAILLGITWNITNNLTIETAEKELMHEMVSKAEILKGYELKESFDMELHQKFRKISQNSKLRITIIRKDGLVVDDSYYSEMQVSQMENHANRPEVKEAFETGSGKIIRRSTTTEQSMYYYASKYNDNLLVRISYPMSYIESLRADMLKQNLAIYFALIIMVGLLTIYLARRINSPIQQLSIIADKIEAGETKIYFPSFRDKTMTKLVSVIYRIYNSMNQKTKQLEQEQRKLNHIFSILDEGIILLDAKDNVKHFNETATAYLGVRLQYEKNVLTQTNNVDALSFLSDVVSYDEDTRIQKEHKKKIYEVYVRVFESEKLIVFSDVTERAEYEQFKTELIGNITHELKTPLAMIMGYSETIMNDPNMDQKFHDKFINIIYNSSNRLNVLINDILQLHKLEMLQESIKVEEPTVLNDLTEEVTSYYADRQKSVDITSSAVEVFINREHIMSVVTNLIDNAMKYSKGDHIHLVFSKENEFTVIEVADHGPVIPDSEQERIFERFYTMEKSKNQNETGTGLGLSIVKHIATLYKGDAKVVKNDKGGNTFVIRLKEKTPVEEES